jgi:hypothetical protein
MLTPLKSEDNSPASFEKALSGLAEKISKSQIRLDSLRQRGRRAKALWTLYSSFAYLLCFVILFLVVGWQNWTAVEYTGVAGSPLLIWGTRTAISTYYTWRIDNASEHLQAQQKERTKTIDKLKAATKYNSTQELLEKYGGAQSKPKESPGPKTPKNPSRPARTSMGPQGVPQGPLNMRPDQAPNQPGTPQLQQLHMTPPVHQLPSPMYKSAPGGQAEFAPNAFSAPPQYAVGDVNIEGHWYDRVLDLLLGEDETSPRNRVALICQNCRLVNGQAPPGMKNLADLGKWRCFGCGTMNTEEDEAAKAVKEMKERISEETPEEPVSPTPKTVEEDASENGSEKDDIKHEVVDVGDDDSAEDVVEVKPRRGRSSRKKTS